jgi:ArsR family transcriptional regulator
MPASSAEFATDLLRLSDQAKALSHPARLAIIRHLAAHDECICGDIVASLPLAQSTVSRHLKVLQEAEVICVTHDGPRSCYCLDRTVLNDIRQSFDTFLEAPAEPITEPS